MCGICGIVHRDAARIVDERLLDAMRDVMTHRGPDDAGSLRNRGAGLGSRRLAILDLSPRGHMPMATPDERYHITYNGEVYNADVLRRELEDRGDTFRSRTDTEVVLRLYAERGPAMLSLLNGMFAFAIWDTRERSLFLARDRLGVKPLYYTTDGDTLLFASEQKALFAAGVAPEFDSACWEEMLCFRFVAGEATPFRHVRRLLPGHFMLWKDGVSRTTRWWTLHERAAACEPIDPDRAVHWYRETFDDAVRLRRISDVPVGVLLSGGLDSSTVAASLASQSGAGVASFTVTFEEAGYDESALARELVTKWQLESHELRVERGALLLRLIEASWLNDEPLAHGNELHLWAISEYAKPRVTVLLSGEGADETLGGYVRYRPLRYPGLLGAGRAVVPALAGALRLDGRARKLSRLLALGTNEASVLFNTCEVLPPDLVPLGMQPAARFPYREAVLAEAKRAYAKDLVRQAMYSDQHTFLCSLLDRNDRMTMGASIECRVPFLDYRLVEGLASLPTNTLLAGGKPKGLLRAALGDRLPATHLKARKWGFGVPWADYLRNVAELREVVESLPRLAPIVDGPFERAALGRTVGAFLAGDRHLDALVRQLVLVALWHQACVAPGGGVRPAVGSARR